MSANSAFHIAVLPGDGIGPEVMAPALEILRRIEATTPSLKFRFTQAPAGANNYRETGKSMPESTVKLCEAADAILLGACGLILDSLARIPMRLPDEFLVRPGHGPETTIGRERAMNPFLQELGSMPPVTRGL